MSSNPVYCPACLKDNPETATTCAACGEPLLPPVSGVVTPKRAPAAAPAAARPSPPKPPASDLPALKYGGPIPEAQSAPAARIRGPAAPQRAVSSETRPVWSPLVGAEVEQARPARPPTEPTRKPAPSPAAAGSAPSPAPKPKTGRTPAGRERRREPRREMHVNLFLKLLDPAGNVVKREITIADNIGRHGARVLTEAPALGQGDLVEIEEIGGDFQTRAEVRSVWVGPDKIKRLGLKFVGRRAPERLTGPGQQLHTPPPLPAQRTEGAAAGSGVEAVPGTRSAGPEARTASPSSTPGPDGKAPSVRAEVLETYQRVKSLSHYEVLGLSADASPQQVKAAYARLAKRYHPDMVGQSGLADLKRPAQSIVIRLGFALNTLTDPESRAFYDRKLKETQQPKPAEPTDEVDLDRGAAERVLRDARQLISGRKYWDAIQALQSAIPYTHDPAVRHLMQVYLAHATAKNPRWLDRAEEILRSVISEDPRNVHAHLLLATICQGRRHAEEAIRMFEKVLELSPGNTEATAALYMLRGGSKQR
jgi:curved DNA-binding protein CbpA